MPSGSARLRASVTKSVTCVCIRYHRPRNSRGCSFVFAEEIGENYSKICAKIFRGFPLFPVHPAIANNGCLERQLKAAFTIDPAAAIPPGSVNRFLDWGGK